MRIDSEVIPSHFIATNGTSYLLTQTSECSSLPPKLSTLQILQNSSSTRFCHLYQYTDSTNSATNKQKRNCSHCNKNLVFTMISTDFSNDKRKSKREKARKPGSEKKIEDFRGWEEIPNICRPIGSSFIFL